MQVNPQVLSGSQALVYTFSVLAMRYQLIAALAVLGQVSDVLGALRHSVAAAIVPKKAGLSGYPGIQNIQAFKDLSPYIGWYSDYNPNTPNAGSVQGVPMLWGGNGSPCDVTAQRLQSFKDTVAKSTPKLMFGFFEPGMLRRFP